MQDQRFPLSKKRYSWMFGVVIVLLVVLSSLLLVYLLHDIDWKTIRQTSPWTILVILGLTVLGTLVYTTLIYLLVRGSGFHTTLGQAYLVLTASLSANYVTPVKVGIPLRVYLYHHFIGMPPATGTALVTIETLVGMLTPAFLAVVGIALVFPSIGLMTPVILIAVLLLGLLAILKLPLSTLQPHLARLPGAGFSTRTLKFFDRVRLGLYSLPAIVVLGAVLLDLTMLGLQAVRLWVILRIFGPTPSPVKLLAVFTISVTAGNLSMIPMGLGVRDASFTLLLAKLGIPNEVALSAAVIQRLFSPGWPLLLGLISSNVLGVREALRMRGAEPSNEGVA